MTSEPTPFSDSTPMTRAEQEEFRAANRPFAHPLPAPASPVPSVEATLAEVEADVARHFQHCGDPNVDTADDHAHIRESLALLCSALLRSDAEPSEDTDNADSVALEVLCRVFDDGADEGMEEWRAWYQPHQWLNGSRALGAFIRHRLNARSAASAVEPSEDRALLESDYTKGDPSRDDNWFCECGNFCHREAADLRAQVAAARSSSSETDPNGQ